MEFTQLMSGAESLYGFQTETLDSLILEILPPIDQTYKDVEKEEVAENSTYTVNAYLLQAILNILRNNAGFHLPRVS